jgi:hypothetical protein
MNSTIKAIILIIISALLFNKTALSQITSSPYSVFGLGTIEESSLGVNKAMGGTGIAFMSGHGLNVQNPASYDGIDSLVTIFELGLFGRYTSYKSSNSEQSLFDSNIRYASMGFRPSSRWATSFGITPYSTIGYKINVDLPVEGSINTHTESFTGEGGVNQVYIGNSYRITKNLVFGLNIVYLFGSVTHSESSDMFNYSLKNVTNLSNFNLNYGLDYRFVKNDWHYTVGLIYNNGKALTTSNTETITTESETEVLRSKTKKYRIPESYGVGLAFGKKHFRGGVDFELRKWKSVKFDNPLLNTRDSKKVSFGLEVPSSVSQGNSAVILLRFGAAYSQSYLVINNVPINSRTISIGAGFPSKGLPSVFNVAVELGQNGTSQKYLFQENYCALHLSIALKDIWFQKRKYD